MKTEEIEKCIQYIEYMEILGKVDPSHKGAEKARAELAALKEGNEKLRELLGEWRKSLQDIDVRIQTRNIAADISFASLIEKTETILA